MKLKAISLYSRILSVLLVWMGFPACSDNDGGDENLVVMYGSPTAQFTVKGNVVSAEGDKKPVKNIRVVLIQNVDESKLPEGSRLYGDTVKTDNEGAFSATRNDFPVYDKKLKVKFEDVDGVENGLFEVKEVVIDFKDVPFKGGDGWYKGEATVDIKKVELTPADEDKRQQ